MRVERSSDLRLLAGMIGEARPYWPHLLLVFVLSLSSVPIALLLPLPLKLVVDNVMGAQPLPSLLKLLLPHDATHSQGAVLLFAVSLLVLVSLLQHLEGFASWVLQSYTGEQLVLRARARLFQHAQRLSLAHHDRVGTADSLSRIHDDTIPTHYIVVSGLVPLLTSSCVLLGLLLVTAYIDLRLALIGLVVVPVLAALTELYRRRVRAGWAAVRQQDASAMAVLQEVLGALRVVKAFGQEEREQQRYLTQARAAMNSQLRVILGEATFGLLVALTLALGTALVLYVGVQHVQSGVLSMGSLLLVMGYLSQLYKPVEIISKKVTSLQASLASADRTLALLDTPVDVVDTSDPVPLVRARGAVTLENVSFRYQDGPAILHDVSLSIPPGARVGIAGPTGAGKTTLISLLLRFFDPSEGVIRLDGVDLRDYALSDLRKQFAMVLQEPVLFSTSIAENIAYGCPGARREAVMHAARLANAHTFITALPHGYDSKVGERGMTLSGGERQRIALARAFLRDAPLLILDEPTSAIDVKNEQEIMDSLEQLMRGRTTFIIAHRLNTLTSCDLRLEVANGQVQLVTTPSAEHTKNNLVYLRTVASEEPR